MHRLIIFITLFSQFYCFAQQDQLNPKSVDSLSSVMDLTQKNIKKWQDSFNHVQDSLYHAALGSMDMKNNIQNLINFQREEKIKKDKEAQQMYIRIASFAAIFVVVIFSWVRKSKRLQENQKK